MPVKPPTMGQLREVAESFGLVLSEEDLASFRSLILPTLASYAEVERMVEPAPLAPKYPRTSGYRPGAGGQPLERLVLALRDLRGARRAAGREAGGHQGQRVRGRRPDDERVGDAGGLRPRGRRHHRYPHPRRRRHHRRQSRLRGPVLLRGEPHRRHRARPQPPGPRPVGRRVVVRLGGAARRRRGRPGHRRRPGRLHPYAGRLVRHRRPQADLRARPLHRRVPHRDDPRPHRADGRHRGRRRPVPRGAGRRRRARSPPTVGRADGGRTAPGSTATSPAYGSASSPKASGGRGGRKRPSTRRCATPPGGWRRPGRRCGTCRCRCTARARPSGR